MTGVTRSPESHLLVLSLLKNALCRFKGRTIYQLSFLHRCNYSDWILRTRPIRNCTSRSGERPEVRCTW